MKLFFFEIATFFVALMKYNFLFGTVAMITASFLLIFIATIVKETNFFSTPMLQCFGYQIWQDDEFPWLAPNP